MKNLVKQTLERDFNLPQYTDFVKNLFNEIQIQPQEIKVPESSKEFIRKITFLSNFSDTQKKTIDIYAVELVGGTKVERARSFQRNLISKLLKDNTKDAGLVAFYSKDNPDWRLSFIKLDYKLTEKGVKVEVGTPPKRYSFLVGKTEPSHTAQKQLLPILGDHKNNPLLSDLEEAFSVERVTKEFYKCYRKLFEDLSNDLKKNKAFQIIAEKEDIDIDNFAKKLLGQIVFLYFLQKKGWLGVPQDKAWGQGDKFFLRTLFNKAKTGKKDFYDHYLEPLFYNTLNNPRRDEVDPAYSRLFDCKIPFLNGGLFEPDYDWKNTIVYLGNEIFEEIIDTFDLYNFTVKEDEPLEKEVAVDPEMLGKVFENLLPENMRKGQGAYYTPREIVHYMCQESLINYLNTETKVDAERIRKLIAFKDEDLVNGNGSRKKALGFSDDEAQSLDRALANIKVCDPACGSGAFLVGMLNEIVSARRILEPRSEYKLKKEVIQECIYGVDIDPGAVDIAKLRLWLSLVVDFELRDIEPLPNLDYKIMCGNSLLEEFEGVRFYDGGIDDASLFKDERKHKIQELREKIKEYFNICNEKEKHKKREEINKLKDWFIKATLEKRRKEITRERRKIEAKADMFQEKNRQEYFISQGQIFISEAKINEVLRELHNPQKARPFFIWKLEFMDVFEDKGGFDVMIANPPYVGEKGHKEVFDPIHKGNLGTYYQGQMDLFYFFFHLSINLGKQGSNIAFITTNYYPTATGGRKLREDFKNRTTILRLINFNELKIFESALGQHNMVTILRRGSNEKVIANTCITRRKGEAKPEILRAIVERKDQETEYFKLAQRELYEGNENYIRIEGHLENSNNPVYTVINKVKRKGDLLSTLCNVNVGLYTGADKVSNNYIQKYSLRSMEKNEGIFVVTKSEIQKLNLNKLEQAKICPFYKNSDIFRWHTKSKPDLFLINVSYPENKEIDFNKIPTIIKHISKYEKILRNRKSNDNGLRAVIAAGYWWSFTIRQIDFNRSKIVVPQRSHRNTFGYNEIPWYASADVYFITEKDKSVSLKYVLALLNSKLYYFWLYYRGKRKGEALELYQQPLSEIPILRASAEVQKLLIEMTNKIICLTNNESSQSNASKELKVKECESQIDHMVYKLYELTPEEIDIVDNFNKE